MLIAGSTPSAAFHEANPAGLDSEGFLEREREAVAPPFVNTEPDLEIAGEGIADEGAQ